MDTMRGPIRAAIATAVVACVTAAPVAAGNATFISGAAGNTLLATYRDLAAQRAVPQIGARNDAVTVNVDESPEAFSIAVHGANRTDRASSSALRTTISAPRSASTRAYFTSLEAGGKTLGPAQTAAVIAALDIAEKQPLEMGTVAANAAAGNYILEVFEPGNEYMFVSMSYPGDPGLGKTAIGCNPRRQFRYDTRINTIVEVKPPCP